MQSRMRPRPLKNPAALKNPAVVSMATGAFLETADAIIGEQVDKVREEALRSTEAEEMRMKTGHDNQGAAKTAEMTPPTAKPMTPTSIEMEAGGLFDAWREESLKRLKTGHGWITMMRPSVWSDTRLDAALGILDVNMLHAAGVVRALKSRIDSASTPEDASAIMIRLRELEVDVSVMVHNVAALIISARREAEAAATKHAIAKKSNWGKWEVATEVAEAVADVSPTGQKAGSKRKTVKKSRQKTP